MSGSCGAGFDTGGNAVRFIEMFVVNAVHTERAFFHDAFGVVIFAGTIGAGPGAEFAANAGFGVDQNDAVFLAFVTRTCGTNSDAGGVFAMQTRAWHVDNTSISFIAVDAVQPHAHGFGGAWFVVGQGGGDALRVPLLAGCGAGLAADAGVEVDDEAQFFGGCGWECGHMRLPSPGAARHPLP